MQEMGVPLLYRVVKLLISNQCGNILSHQVHSYQ